MMSRQYFEMVNFHNLFCNSFIIHLFIVLIVSISPMTIHCLNEKTYTNQFAVHIPNGSPDEIAAKSGFVNKGQIGTLDGYYLFEHHNINKRSTAYSNYHHLKLKEFPEVLWTEQQHVKRRVKRDNNRTDFRYSSLMEDPLFKDQWYLNRGARGGFDMNVAGAWNLGYSGKGVVVTILDDGIQSDHPDLSENYDAQASYDINDNDPDPTPQDNGDNKHGTRCAGEVAAVAYNQFCGVGIAFHAGIGGVRMLDGTVTDEVEARALSLNPSRIDIYSASWGPEDDGKTVDGPGRLAQIAFIDGIRKGRSGLGSIFVWASGNGGRRQDNCNCDGYTNSIYTLSISSATQNGAKPWYLEECSSTLATTYSSGTPGRDMNVVTVDQDTSYFKSLSEDKEPLTNNLCTRSHTGTSASAPIAAAICALALEANHNLSWRDMQHLVVMTSRYEPLRHEEGWVTNGVGRKVSHKFGYGLMDAEAIVRLAEQWTTAPSQRICETPFDTTQRKIPENPDEQLETYINTNACRDSSNEIRYVEHVQARITLKFRPRGNLKITLVSPSGTPSDLLLPRPRDTEESTFNHWPFLSVHYWGEQPAGVWKLIIKNDGSKSRLAGKLLTWSLVFYGSYLKPRGYDLINNGTYHYLPRRTYQSNIPQNDCANQGMFFDLNSKKCEKICSGDYFGDYQTGTCVKCHDLCSTCYGPTSDNCLSCNSSSYYYGDRCVNHCPDSYYADEVLRECLPCSSGCHTCEETPVKCTTCSGKLQLNDDGRCANTCPNNRTNCTKCHERCASCVNEMPDGCSSCKSGFRLVFGVCILDVCPSDFYELKNVNGSECAKCHYSCKTCHGPSHTQCSSCNSTSALKNGICYPCLDGLFMNQVTRACELCHSNCNTCNGPTSTDCTSCNSPMFIDGSKCVPCCPKHNNEIEVNLIGSPDCCECRTSRGPCLSQEHIRSVLSSGELNDGDDLKMHSHKLAKVLIDNPNSVITAICVASVFIFVIVFSLLQMTAMRECGNRHEYRDYKKVSTGLSAKYDKSMENIRLTSEDLDEEDCLFEKT